MYEPTKAEAKLTTRDSAILFILREHEAAETAINLASEKSLNYYSEIRPWSWKIASPIGSFVQEVSTSESFSFYRSFLPGKDFYIRQSNIASMTFEYEASIYRNAIHRKSQTIFMRGCIDTIVNARYIRTFRARYDIYV